MANDLSFGALAGLSPKVAVPDYDRSALSAGIVHIGVGNFHRAHQAVYLDRLFGMGRDHDWAIVGAGIMPFDATKRDVLSAQDWLTTVVELDPSGFSARVIGAMIDFCPTDAAAIIDQISDPAIRIVSLTVTEGGYFVDALTGGFDSQHEAILAEVDAALPETVFGIIIAGLKARRAAGVPAFTVMSCDNLPENGHVAQQAVVGLARLMDPELSDWINANVAFPNGMVDCITPATSPAEIAMVRDTFGLNDAAPVTCEPFRQWVLEDNFPAGRPALEEVGVEFVKDVRPHELMKLRILNGGHAAIAYVGDLMGYEFVHDAMADPAIRDWYRVLAKQEIIPTLEPIPDVSYDAYLASCIERFSNAAVRDTIPRLCLDGSNRQPKFILPTVQDALAKGLPIEGLALEVALWCRYCAVGPVGKVVDERAEVLTNANGDADAFLAIADVFGDLGQNQQFATAVKNALASLAAHGPKATLQAYTKDK